MAGAEGAQGWWLDNTGGLKRSLRFNSSDSAYLSRTPSVAGNRKTWTWSGWVKKCSIDSSSGRGLFSADITSTSDSTFFELRFGTGAYPNSLSVNGYSTAWRITTQVFRDASAWYHIVLAVDTTQATGANRIKIYVNGVQITSFVTSNDPAQNADLGINNNTLHNIGRGYYDYLSGYLADIHFIDGQALEPTAFGEFDSNGVWNPKTYLGTYGTNGFNLPFSDNSTASALGTDVSGNDNDCTVNNISVAAGAGNDSLLDFPINHGEDTGRGGEVRGNYATLNPLQLSGSNRITLSNGNLQGAGNSIYYGSAISTISVNSGKWYAEFTFTLSSTYPLAGIIKTIPLSSTYQNSDDQLLGRTADAYGYRNDQKLYNNNSVSTYGASWTDGDVIGVALDMDAGTLTFYKNGVSQGQAASALSGYYAIGCSVYGSAVCNANFGQRPFAYQAPAGYKALCTNNLPELTIEDGSQYMDVKLYTGNGSTQTISGLGFSPDLVWAKVRNTTGNHSLYDAVRGVTKRLSSSLTNAEATFTNSLTSFDTNGFSLGSNPDGDVNASGNTYVAWTWDAGSLVTTNTDGSITSTVKANPTAGFSIVTWTGTASAGTVGHGLGVAPEFIIVKNRSVADSWYCYHKSLGNAARIQLNETSAQTTGSSQWNSTSPTSTVYSVGAGSWQASGNLIVSYCFAPVAGYSAFGSYTGNGSADGPFVYTGFRPRFVMFKRTDAAYGWLILDTSRDPYNVMTQWLEPNQSSSESTLATTADFLSNGFKLRNGTWNITNVSGGTYIYAAFAEHPLRTSRAR